MASILPPASGDRRHGNSTCFRARYYARLGIVPQTSSPSSSSCSRTASQRLLQRQSSSSVSSSSSLPNPPCLRHKRSVLHTTPARDNRVSFHPEVRLYRIKHHEDYSDEEWNGMWVDGDTLDYEKDRNTLEFQADGADWRNATEEDAFQRGVDGALVHPATYIACRYHWEKYGESLDEDGRPRVVDFKSFLTRKVAPPQWSPRPVRQRKTFWLLDLAMESVQKGKNAAVGSRRQANHSKSANTRLPQSSSSSSRAIPTKPTRQVDRGWP